MRKLVTGILAHVDAGKTTLSEALLYFGGSIRKPGRVDKGDAFLDTYGQERERGITIFSKEARISYKALQLTLLDTPGHVDFSAEMERTLQVLDMAILVISASAGVQGHTRTLWRLLNRYGVPIFVFVNKMDQPDTDRETILEKLKADLSEYCIDFTDQETEEFFENIAVSDEGALNEFLTTDRICDETIQKLIRERKIFPCFFGSALKLTGVEELLNGLLRYTGGTVYPAGFGARIFKITRDAQGNRLTHMKITGGSLKARDELSGTGEASFLSGGQIRRREPWTEKINQIRLYSGEKFETHAEVTAGEICAVTGLTKTRAGEGLGFERGTVRPELSPILSYSVLLPDGMDAAVMLQKLRQLEEEEPQLHIVWDERNKEIKAQIMGQVQTEVYRNLIRERFNVDVDFGTGSIVYKETIANTVEGVGHFEPLRHYAEVHLLLEPGLPGSGLRISSDCREDLLDLNWQRLVLTHLEEKEHPGVLAGAPITDMKITLKAGRAHLKHTEGGDFRQATYRALRQGLMQAENVLLEPYYDFRLEVPDSAVGRAMSDLDKMRGNFSLQQSGTGTAVLEGMAPMALLQDYQKEVVSYTKGAGQLHLSLKGYFPCHNTEEVLENAGYDPERDVENPSSSVFCAHGAGFLVAWDEAPSYMHLESCLKNKGDEDGNPAAADGEEWSWLSESGEDRIFTAKGAERVSGREKAGENASSFIGTEEIDEILNRTAYANRKGSGTGNRNGWRRNGRKEESTLTRGAQTRTYKQTPKKEAYLLVDGYNVIFAWDELKELAEKNLDGARGRLLDLLCNYQAVKGCRLIAVFDAYRLAGHPTEVSDYHNIHVVFTKEAETADQYIEKFAHENSHKYDVTVATSDGLEQIIIIGEGCRLMSSRELKEDIERLSREIVREFEGANPGGGAGVGEKLAEKLQGIKEKL
ncbi:MAG: GTP-binding protein [Lachnospiraceae bacterium]|jgi:ribosomal protection tetracycline resistance protein|nr:GTP-binding protein [Lachnospiraceae bacterium]